MSIVRYQPWNLATALHNELERTFDERSTAGAWRPAVDVRETDAEFLLSLDVPGVDPSDIEVTADDGVLTVTGKRETQSDEKREGFHRVERVSGEFTRRFTLPDTADAGAISASSSNGVLIVNVPKQPKAQPQRISVKAA